MGKNKIVKIEDEIVFVTSNKGKVASAQRIFKDIKLEIYNYELIEPRSDDIKEIAKSKVRQAYKVVKKPCIALDAGFFIDELNGFPRAFVNFALDTIGVNGILKLMENVENRRCAFKECLAYYDGKNMLLFNGNHEGILSTEMRGVEDDKQWSALWYVYIPFGHTKTLAEMSDEEKISRIKCEENTDAMDQFVEYYNKTKELTR